MKLQQTPSIQARALVWVIDIPKMINSWKDVRHKFLYIISSRLVQTCLVLFMMLAYEVAYAVAYAVANTVSYAIVNAVAYDILELVYFDAVFSSS